MIPRFMEIFLKDVLPERTWRNRLARTEGRCFMEFGVVDIERLSRLGITVDQLGPKLVACLWDEASSLEIGGYLVVDNLAMGRPAVGGIRMLPDLTPADVFYLARGMTLKNAAADLANGGAKAGIIADPHMPAGQRQEVIKRFAALLLRYSDLFLPGPDVGTHTLDMRQIAIQNGLDMALSKPTEMGGNCEAIGAAGGGLVIALQTLLQELPRLRNLPQFINLQVPEPDQLTVLLQGFGTVGANTARILRERLPHARVTGISDSSGYLYHEWGLPVDELYTLWQTGRPVIRDYFTHRIFEREPNGPKFGTCNDDLLNESAFCFIPAAPTANYLGIDPENKSSVSVQRMGHWSMIIEGANTYSPDPARRAARQRMEREVYRQRGVLIATDFLVNSGAVIYGAHEHHIQTPDHLQLPEEILGNEAAVDNWLKKHANEFKELAQLRLEAAEKARDEVIRRNMREFLDLLVADPDLLPCEAAEQISIQRISVRERNRTAAEIMETAVTVSTSCSIQEAAALLIETGSSLLAVVDELELLVGVVTQWDITRATADGLASDNFIANIMSHQVIAAAPTENLLEVVRKLEYHEVSVLPIVLDGKVLGLVSTDSLARRSLLPLLIKQTI